MNTKEVHRLVMELASIVPKGATDDGLLLEAALFVEDIFGFILSDEEICEETLGTPEAIERFVLEKLKRQRGCAESVE